MFSVYSLSECALESGAPVAHFWRYIESGDKRRTQVNRTFISPAYHESSSLVAVTVHPEYTLSSDHAMTEGQQVPHSCACSPVVH